MKPEDNWWLIWSNEHNGWWRPNSNGYTKEISEAGRYTFDEAVEIVNAANTSDGRWFERKEPEETMCPDWRKK